MGYEDNEALLHNVTAGFVVMKAAAVVPVLTSPVKTGGFAFLERLNECWKWLSHLWEIVNRQLDANSDIAPDKGQHALSEDLPALHPVHASVSAD